MTSISVTGVGGKSFGRILVRQGRLVEHEGMFTQYHRVGFNYRNGGTEWYDIGSLPFQFGAQHTFSLYGTVCAALSFYLADGAGGAEEWDAYTEIPIGYADATRHAYRVTGDGQTSWAVGDRYRGKRVRLTRYHDEPIGEAVSRCLATWGDWKDAGVFDCPDASLRTDGTSERWYTVPIESLPRSNGDIPCTRHSVRFTGEVTTWLPTLVTEWVDEGLAWR